MMEKIMGSELPVRRKEHVDLDMQVGSARLMWKCGGTNIPHGQRCISDCFRVVQVSRIRTSSRTNDLERMENITRLLLIKCTPATEAVLSELVESLGNCSILKARTTARCANGYGPLMWACFENASSQYVGAFCVDMAVTVLLFCV